MLQKNLALYGRGTIDLPLKVNFLRSLRSKYYPIFFR